jgi:hypothetical protein
MQGSVVLRWLVVVVLPLLIVGLILSPAEKALAVPVESPPIPLEIDPGPPEETAKLVFVHASVGNMWLGLWYGQLGSIADGGDPIYYAETSLKDNNYFVSDYNAPHEHPGEWPEHDYCAWRDLFGNPDWMDRMLSYNTSDGSYDRLADPGGENDIIMIKPCFTQYPILGSPGDPPSAAGSPCEGNGTVGDIKRAMLDLLEDLGQRSDKFFVLVTAPPKPEDKMTYGENARAISNWMVHEWLDGYDVGNVMVFDLFNVLTSNHQGAGDPCQLDEDEQSDVGLGTGNHHRIWNGEIQHQVAYDQEYSAYCDGHQKKGGLRKATSEFVPLLNTYYNAWVNGAGETIAGFVAEPRAGPAPLTVQFTDTSAGGPTAWLWDFGDASSPSSRQHPSYTYTIPDSYTVTLSVSRAEPVDNDTIVKVDFISVTPVSLKADFTADPTLGLLPLTVAFTDMSIGDVLTRTWQFGDGTTASQANPTHVYRSVGSYTVGLTVQDVFGSHTLERPRYIEVRDVVRDVYLPVILRDYEA